MAERCCCLHQRTSTLRCVWGSLQLLGCLFYSHFYTHSYIKKLNRLFSTGRSHHRSGGSSHIERVPPLLMRLIKRPERVRNSGCHIAMVTRWDSFLHQLFLTDVRSFRRHRKEASQPLMISFLIVLLIGMHLNKMNIFISFYKLLTTFFSK